MRFLYSRPALAAFVFWFCVASWGGRSLSAQDWPQWQGPDRDGVWQEENLISKFPEGGPTVLWRKPVAGGYAGPAVSGGRVFLMDYQIRSGDPTPDPEKRNEIEGTERILCLDARSGEWLWEQAWDCPYRISYPAGPRCTPTVDGDRVYCLGAEGHLKCLKAEDGAILWEVDLKQRYGMTEAPLWGFSAHPLVWGDLLYTMIGGEKGALVALDKMTGAEKWRACPDSEAGYCPPTVVMAGGTAQLLCWTPTTINSLNPASGEVYWSFPLEPLYAMSVAPPAVSGDRLFASGLGKASISLRLDPDRPAASLVWEGKGFNTSHSPVVIIDGHAIGVDRGSKLRCISLDNGKRIWETDEPTAGGDGSSSGGAFLVRCGDRWLIAGENGVLTIARLSPEKYEAISSVRILEPTQDAFGKKVVWSHPAFADGCCYWKNDQELVCVSLRDPGAGETGNAPAPDQTAVPLSRENPDGR